MTTFVFLIVLGHAGVPELLDALEVVESHGNVNAVGDRGLSRGPLQIQRAYHRDSGVPGDYLRVHERKYARRVVVAYWRRYEPAALKRCDVNALARLHNAGPGWRTKMKATDGYVAKVKRQLRKETR